MRMVRRGLICERVQNAHNLQRNHRACPVIRSAGTRDPAIQVAAHHHHLVFQRGIGSWNFGNRVEAMFMVSRELGFHVHLNGHRNVVLEQPIHPAVALNLRDHDRKRDSRIPVIRSRPARRRCRRK